MSINVGTLEALLVLRDQLTPTLTLARSAINDFAKDHKETFADIGKAVGVMAAAVSAAAAGIVALGVRGSEVADVAGNFDRLTDAAGDSASVLQTLRDSVDGTIGDFDLMKASNIALSQNLSLTKDQFRLLGESSRVLADTVGGSTLEAYEKLMMAMATGQDRTLKSIGLDIDAKGATEAYAASLGKTAEQLDDSQKKLAIKNAILAELARQLGATGRAELDFADNIDRAKTAFSNFTDALGVAIAESPVLKTLLGSVGDQITKAFGEDQAAKVKALTKIVNDLAITLVNLAKGAVEVGRIIALAFNGVQRVLTGLSVIFTDLLDSFGTGMGKLIGGLQALPRAARGIFALVSEETLTKSRKEYEDTAALMAAASRETVRRVAEGFNEAVAIEGGAATAQKFLGGLEAQMKAAAAAAVELGDAGNEKTGPGLRTVAQASAEAAEAARKAAEEFAKLVDGYRETITAAGILAKEQENIQAILISLGVVTDATAASVLRGMAALMKYGDEGANSARQIRDAWEEANDVLLLATRDMGMGGLFAVPPGAAAQMKTYADVLAEVLAKNVDLQDVKRQEILWQQALNEAVSKGLINMDDYVRLGGQVLERDKELRDAKAALIKEFERLAEIAGLAVEGFDSLNATLGALGVSADSDIRRTVEGLGDLAEGLQQAGEAAFQFSQGTVAGTIGGIVSSIKAIGSFASGFGKLFGGDNAVKERIDEIVRMQAEMENLRQSFFDSAGGAEELMAQAAQAGVALDGLFDARNARELEQTIDRIGSQLADWEEAQEVVNDALERYGITLEQTGEAWRQQGFDQIAAGLIRDWETLNSVVDDQAVIVEGMGDALLEYAERTRAAGVAIPSNLRPAFQALLDQGKILDENGEAFGTLEEAGFSFTETLTEGLGSAVRMIERLVLALERWLTLGGVPVTVAPGGGGGPAPYRPPPKDYDQDAFRSIPPSVDRGRFFAGGAGSSGEASYPTSTSAGGSQRASSGGGGNIYLTLNVAGSSDPRATARETVALIERNVGGLKSKIKATK